MLNIVSMPLVALNLKYHSGVKYQRPTPALVASFVQQLGSLLSKLGFNVKRLYELTYWRWRYFQEKGLSHSWYEGLFTEIPKLDRSIYSGKKVVDIGCGPRGSLEWLDDAALRVGIDPLLGDYLKFGIEEHASNYVASQVEDLPFKASSIDVVTSFNSLDHVDDLMLALKEIERVLASGGYFILLVEVHPKSTLSEPITIPWNLTSLLSHSFLILKEDHFEECENRPGSAAAARSGIAFDHDDPKERSGTLLTVLQRR